MSKRSQIKEWFKAMLFALVTVIIIKVFFMEGAYSIPTSSMEKTLEVGDFIFVNKLSYGSRIPITPLTIPFTHQTIFSSGIKSYLDWISIPYYRLPGFTDINRNDVIVFNYPMEGDIPVDHRTNYVKRCIALPGDLIEIKESKVYINDSLKSFPLNSQLNYLIKTNGNGLNIDTLEKLDITEGGKISAKGDYMFALTENKIKRIKEIKDIKEIKPYCDKKGNFSEFIFPHSEKYPWNIDNFGPLKIPRAGDSIVMNLKNLALYEQIISMHEHNTLEVKNDSIFINGKAGEPYVFKMNYYFMMGDNRHNSADSRFWGFVPEDHIVGKATRVLLSIDKQAGFFSKIRWDRCFKKIE